MNDDAGRTVAAAEQWFVRHGLPYFVDSEREAVRQGLRPRRLGTVLVTALAAGVGLGVVVGLLAHDASLAISSAMATTAALSGATR